MAYAEVDAHIAAYADQLYADDRRLVMRNGWAEPGQVLESRRPPPEGEAGAVGV